MSQSRPIHVLAVHDGHDAGACVLRDGSQLFCSSEERRINRKNFAGVPKESIRAVLAASGLSPTDIGVVALSGRIRNTVPTPGHKPVYTVLNVLSSIARTEWGTRLGQWVLSRKPRRQDLYAFLAETGLAAVPVRAYDHHLTHAATAYFHRPWIGSATVLTLDGAGDGLCSTVSTGIGESIERLAFTPKFHSPAAWMYSAATAHLGMKPNEHEYKVMGMAPYGQRDSTEPIFRRMFEVAGLKFRNRTGRIGSDMLSHLARTLSGKRFDDVAAGCQAHFEEMMLAWVRNAMDATKIPRVACAGGAFLNVKANKLIRELPGLEALFVYPASDDGGTPIGAAILGYLEECRFQGRAPCLQLPKTMHLGLEFSDVDCEAALKGAGFSYRRMADPPREVAQRLADGYIVGRFSGREEVGPRSLGNRSILADPRQLTVIRRLNFAIKHRDFWMPFAASILEEEAAKYVQKPSAWAYYMIEAFDTTPEAARELIAGMHPFDLTIRPQFVNDMVPEYRELLRAFKALTGVGGLLNTSFNLHGSPIVGSPEVAVQTLRASELDALALGPFLVEKRSAT